MKLTRNHFKVFVLSLTICLLIGYFADVLFDVKLYQFLIFGSMITLFINHKHIATAPKKQ
ncbi:hypothetical protein R1T16_10525 [Flavobacterium sp. DG1-102-2]|uniref:hypothetical protein n=1 Tax=Flavobacterium sp. DG1-102-2 TaxID=3081663 RepID=UPI002949A8C2|nr:hypothetical protein [Flavobacterium sp. DG1-102-2]MDV6168861.1 hypothetical protein [Flavobacterium sp. DG1-102-2]